MKLLAPIVLLSSILFLVGCSKSKSEDQLVAEIDQLQASEQFDALIPVMQDFITRFRDSDKRPKIMKELASLYASKGDFTNAVTLHDQIMAEYNDDNLRAQSLFMTGYIYANEIKDLEMARQKYHAFLERYPNHELVPSVKWELEHLGKDLSEIEFFTNESKPAANGKQKGADQD